ncbi:Uncharacterised protein [Yersinia frederiksenii]|nr:Uncharacterised protein [Yersinia frederiksenii]
MGVLNQVAYKRLCEYLAFALYMTANNCFYYGTLER